MVERALENPLSIEIRIDFPFLISSLILSNMITFASTAIPTDRIAAAIPGNVNVACNAAYTYATINIYATSAISAINPGRRYTASISNITKRIPKRAPLILF